MILLWSLNTVLLIMNVECGAQPVAVPQAMERVQVDDGEAMDDDEVQDILWRTGAHLFNCRIDNITRASRMLAIIITGVQLGYIVTITMFGIVYVYNYVLYFCYSVYRCTHIISLLTQLYGGDQSYVILCHIMMLTSVSFLS